MVAFTFLNNTNRRAQTKRMQYEKVYVGVIAKFLSEGGMRPIEIIWTDGKHFAIDKTRFIDRAASRAGGLITVRYTVIICGEERYLYYEKPTERWFVEKKLL